MAQKNSRASINFTSYITERTEYFVGREWAFKVIDDWLADPDAPRYFIIIGEPGIGKTAMASRLAQISQGAVAAPAGLTQLTADFLSALHFCSARGSRWIDPYVFAESLALQLAECYPAYAKALAEKSGDRQIHIEVQQRVEHAEGPVQGVVINSINARGGQPEDAFNRIIGEPFEALYQNGFDQQVIILVDALDEALTYSGNVNIISLLGHIDDLPSGVRFILTSRQDSRVENAFLDADELVLSDAKFEQRNQEDNRQYVNERFGNDEPLAMKAAPLEADYVSEKIVETIVKKAEGNFLYTRFLLDAIASGKRSLTGLDGLPEGLDELYFESLQRIVRLGKDDWHNDYAPLIGMLSVAQENPSLGQLQSFTDEQSKMKMLKHLDDLGQFIEEVKSPNVEERRYRLYHQSVIDFLHSQSLSIRRKELQERRNTFYLPADEWHKALVVWCERGELTAIWEDTMLDLAEQGRRTYARRYYLVHLFQARMWKRLFEMLDEGQYGRAKVRADPSMQWYAQDLDLGRKAARWDGGTLEGKIEHLPHLWRYTLLRCSLRSHVDAYPEEAFEWLLQHNRDMEAVRSAALLTDPHRKARAFLRIADFYITHPERITQSHRLFEQAFVGIKSIPELYGADDKLSQLGIALAQANHLEEAQEVIASIQYKSNKAAALGVLGQSLARANQKEEATHVRQEIRNVIASIQDQTWRDKTWSKLGETLAKAKQWQEAGEAIPSIQYEGDRAEALGALGQSQANQWQEATRFWQEAYAGSASISDTVRKTQALSELGEALAQANQWQLASQVWQEAHEVSLSIEDDSERDHALWILGLMLVEAKLWQQAQKVIAFIPTRDDRANALRHLGMGLAQANRWQEATQIWQKAQDLSLFYIGNSERVNALTAFSRVLAKAKLWQEAQEVIASIQDNYQKTWALSELGEALAQANQWQLASQVWQEAQNVSRLIQDNGEKSYAQEALSETLAEAKQWQEAQEVIAAMQDDIRKTWALNALGKALAQDNQRQQASKVWQESQKVSASLEYGHQSNGALRDLCLTLAEANRWQEAHEVLASIDP